MIESQRFIAFYNVYYILKFPLIVTSSKNIDAGIFLAILLANYLWSTIQQASALKRILDIDLRGAIPSIYLQADTDRVLTDGLIYWRIKDRE